MIFLGEFCKILEPSIIASENTTLQSNIMNVALQYTVSLHSCRCSIFQRSERRLLWPFGTRNTSSLFKTNNGYKRFIFDLLRYRPNSHQYHQNSSTEQIYFGVFTLCISIDLLDLLFCRSVVLVRQNWPNRVIKFSFNHYCCNSA